MASLFTEGKFQALDSSGNPLSSGKLYTYAAGTLTSKATYTTQAGDVANANPVVLDSSGRAAVWLGAGGYRMVLKTSADVTVWDTDNIQGGDGKTVDDYGADPTGVADSTAAFRAMLADTGGYIFLRPFATYLVDVSGYPTTRAVLHQTGGSFVMMGYFSTIKTKSTTSGPIGCNHIELTNVSGSYIAGVIFDGNRQGQSYGYHGIAYMGGERHTMRDCVLKNFYFDGIYVRASSVSTFSTYPKDVILDNVIAEANGRNGLSVIGANGFEVRGGYYRNTVGDPGAGIDVEPNVSDIYGVRGLKIHGTTFSGNAGRGLVITGNAPGSPGETPFCLDAEVTDISCSGNSDAQSASIGGCDVYVARCLSFTMRGYKNVLGESRDPMDAGLVYIHNSVEHATVDGFEVKGAAFVTNTKSAVYIDSGNEPHRTVRNGRVSDTNGRAVSGGKYSVIDTITCEDVTGDVSILSGTTDSALTSVTAIRSSVIQAYNTSGTGAYSIRGITIIDPTARGLRLYQQGSTVRDVIVRHSGTPVTQAVWLESITDCNLSGFTISDAGGYWDTNSNAYLITQSSLAVNRIRDMVPSPLSGSASWTPGSIAAGASVSTNVTLLRGTAGSDCTASFDVGITGLAKDATVISANTAQVWLTNRTGSPINPGTLNVTVEAIQ